MPMTPIRAILTSRESIANMAPTLWGQAKETPEKKNRPLPSRRADGPDFQRRRPVRTCRAGSSQIGRASGRERGCQYVQIPGVAGSLKKKKTHKRWKDQKQ